jgi:VIT1/CCC1 family predicted Fe2+/Mn2+ transporter
MTGVAFAGIGILKGYLSKTSTIASGVQTLALGTIAASIAYGVGAYLA